MADNSNGITFEKPPLWPSLLAMVITILLSFLLCQFLQYQFPNLLIQFQKLPWIILGIGTSIGILLGFIVYMWQLIIIKNNKCKVFNHNFNEEMIQHMHVEETKQKLERALLQGQKLQAIGTLAGGIAHDFNNILYAITGYVEMARDDVAKDTIIHKNLGKVLEASYRGQELIGRILTFSGRHHQSLKPIKIKQTLEGVFALLRPTIPASVTLDIQPMADNLMILGDPTKLHQVIVNIVNNAVDAMDGDGKITITINRVLARDPFLRQFPDVSFSNYCKIDIMDTGHGMDQHTAERIFEPFFTTKEVGRGTGLGLATVHTIVQEHLGKIIVNSQLGHGTTFTLLLPEFEEEKNG